MKKCKLIFTVATVLLLSLIMAVTASAADAPARETAEEIFFDMGFSTWGTNYFGCSMTDTDGEQAPDEVVFQYMYLSGTLNDYYDDETGYYTIAYDEYISLVDKTFVNHSDMKAYLADMTDPETNVITWFRGGFGGPETWIPTDFCVKGDYCYVTGVFADRDIESYPDFPSMEYGKETINTDDYQAVIISGLILTLQDTEDGWKILEYRETSYYVVDDMLYSDDEMFYRFTIEDNGNVDIKQNDDSVDFVTGFYGVAGVWHPEISNHSYNIKADENYVIESVILNDANGETVLEPVDDVYTFDVVGIATLKVTTRGIPAIKEHEGNLVYFIGNDIATDFTGLVEFDNFVYYVENGIVKQDYTGLVCYNDIWYYVENGIINWDYTGLVYHNNAWYYVADGVLDWGYTGLTYYNNAWYYVEYGALNWNYTGLAYHDDAWYYVEYGVLNWNYTGLTYFYGEWYYVEYGVLNWNYTDLTYFYGDWYYVENGKVNFNATTLDYFYGEWYYVENGKVNFNATTLCYFYGDWYYVENGKVNFNATTLCYFYGDWYYVEYGKVNFNTTTLFYFYDQWYYVENGKVNFHATTLVYFCGNWYYVYKGVLDWNYTGVCSFYGEGYYVKDGVVDFSFTGMCLSGWCPAYIVKGIVNRSYTGLYDYNGTWYLIENGYLVYESILFEQNGIVYFVDNGTVNFDFTGFVEVEGYWLYVEEGIWDYTFEGKVDLEDGTFAYIEEGVVVDIR